MRALPGAPREIRTPVLALKGLRPGPLDDGGISEEFYHILPFSNIGLAYVVSGCMQAGVSLRGLLTVNPTGWVHILSAG